MGVGSWMATGWGFWRKEARNALQAGSQIRSKVSIPLWDAEPAKEPRPRAGAPGFSTPSLFSGPLLNCLLWFPSACIQNSFSSILPLPHILPLIFSVPLWPQELRRGCCFLPSFLWENYWKIASVANLGYNLILFGSHLDIELFDSVITHE